MMEENSDFDIMQVKQKLVNADSEHALKLWKNHRSLMEKFFREFSQ